MFVSTDQERSWRVPPGILWLGRKLKKLRRGDRGNNLSLGTEMERRLVRLQRECAYSHSMASSMDSTCHNQKAATSFLDSMNGPPMTVRFSPKNLTRTPFEVG